MKLTKALCLAVLFSCCSLSFAAPPAASPAPGVITVGHVRAVTALLAAMQAEKMMRTIAGTSHYESEQQRNAVYAKLEKVPPAQIYARLAYPLARTISEETANEMTRFYSSGYGKKLVYQMYNRSASLYGSAQPVPNAAERKNMSRPAFIKARKSMDESEDIIHHQGFLLLQSIVK